MGRVKKKKEAILVYVRTHISIGGKRIQWPIPKFVWFAAMNVNMVAGVGREKKYL